jgi:serine/threonine-protein kinase
MTHTDEQIQDLVREMYTTAESTDWQLTAEDARSHRARGRLPVPDVKVMLLAAAAVLLILVGIGVARGTQTHKATAGSSTTTTSTTTVGTVTVPVGALNTTVANATAIITSGGLKVAAKYVSGTSAAGTVLAVTPSAGALVADGSTVTLTVSSGPSDVRVPNVVGLNQTAAAAALGQAGLNVGAVTTVQSTTFAPGVVVSQNPAADSSISPGASVDLSVSSGP